jgi:saccharopine dehydrogenase-like NADP-dependent oxidoreductase
MRVLIVGGYGTFGRRLVHRLSADPRLTLLVAGRSRTAAEAFVAGKQAPPSGAARLEAVVFDRTGHTAAELAALKPGLVIDAAGPFQDAPGHSAPADASRYRLVESAIAQRVPYLDIADATPFVAGISQFHASALAAGIPVISGLSTFPALSSAVVRHLARELAAVDRIEIGIAPSPKAGIGRNVVEAIARTAGQPVALVRQGRAATALGLMVTGRNQGGSSC